LRSRQAQKFILLKNFNEKGGDCMPIDFFELELKKARDRFNQTFGTITVCDLKLRQSVILAICFMGNVGRKIKNAANKDKVREQIKKFMKTRLILNNLFDQFEREHQERRKHVGTHCYGQQQRNDGKHVHG
jgi:hypothetical protein